MSDVLDRLGSQVEAELEKIIMKGNMTPPELDNAMKAVCLLEKIEEVSGMAGGYSEGYSGRRGRSPVTGRYVSRDNMVEGSSRMRGSYDMRGYSGHSIHDRMIAKLEEMYDEAKTDHERNTVDKWIKRLETEQ